MSLQGGVVGSGGRRRRGFALLTATSLAALAFSSCRQPTEITIELATDANCADVHGLALTVGRLDALEAQPPAVSTASCRADGYLGAIVVVPSGAKNDPLAVRAVMGFGQGADVDACVAPAYGKGCVVERRALRFVPHQPLTLPIAMHAACAGVVCDTNQTCTAEKRCVSAVIADPDACAAPGGCPETALSTPSTGGASQGGASASGGQAAEGALGAAGQAGEGGAGGQAAHEGAGGRGGGGQGGGQGGGGQGGGGQGGGGQPGGQGGGAGTVSFGTISNWLDAAADNDAFYWLRKTCEVVRVAANDGATTTVASFGATCTALALDAVNVYVSDYKGGAVAKAPRAGGQVTSVATGQTSVGRVASNGSFVYWLRGETNAVTRAPVGGGAPSVVVAGGPFGQAITLSATKVIWAPFSEIDAAPLAGGAATKLVTQVDPFALANDGTFVYWPQGDGYALYRMPIGGGTPQQIATGAVSFVFAGDKFCWARSTPGESVYCESTAGGAPTAVATADSPTVLAMNKAYVFWTSPASNALSRTRLP